MIEVYVAGASRHWQRARAFIDRVKAHPKMRVTYDWTIDVTRTSKPDYSLTAEERTTFACADLEGIARADVLVVLLDASVASVGRWVELGYALRLRDEPGRRVPTMRIIVSGGQRLSIFTAPGMVDAEFTDSPGSHDDDAWYTLAGYAVEGTPPMPLPAAPVQSERCGSCGDAVIVGQNYEYCSNPACDLYDPTGGRR